MTDNQTAWEQKKQAILKNLSQKELEALKSHSLIIHREKGDHLDLAGNFKIYVIDQGYIRFSRVSQEGKRFITGFCGPADLLGSLSGKKPETPEPILEVVRDARLIAIEAPVFTSVLCDHPEFLFRLVAILEDQKRSLEKRIINILFKDVTAQTANVLLELGHKFIEPCASEPRTLRDISLTHQEIADLAGLARPTVSKALGRMIKAGLLHKHAHNLCLYDLKGIQAVAEHGERALEGLKV